MFALIFAKRRELWRVNPEACAAYIALSIWSRASRNLLEGGFGFSRDDGLRCGTTEWDLAKENYK